MLLIHGQNNHLAQSVKIALQSVKSQGFFLFQWVATLLFVHQYVVHLIVHVFHFFDRPGELTSEATGFLRIVHLA